MDNSIVAVASTIDGTQPLVQAKRYSSTDKHQVYIIIYFELGTYHVFISLGRRSELKVFLKKRFLLFEFINKFY